MKLWNQTKIDKFKYKDYNSYWQDFEDALP